MKASVRVLSLKRSTERRRRFEAEAARVGLHFEYRDGIEAGALEGDRAASLADQDRAQRRYGRTLGLAEIACAEGHRRIYRELAASGDDAAVVVEDDVQFGDGFAQVLLALQGAGRVVAERSQVFLLGRNLGYPERPLWLRRSRAWRLTSGHQLLPVVRSDGALHGTFGYVITRTAATSMLAGERLISAPADAWDLFREAGSLQAIWVLDPPVVLHPLVRTDSLISDERARIAAEQKLAGGASATALARAVRIATDPARLARSVSHRLRWQRFKRAAYDWLSRVS